MSDHIASVGKMVGARDLIAAAIWQYELEIVGAPAQVWETWSQSDPETAAIYQTHAGCVLAALSAAGWVVVPMEPNEAMQQAAPRAVWGDCWNELDDDAQTEAMADCAAIYRAMIAAAPQEDT